VSIHTKFSYFISHSGPIWRILTISVTAVLWSSLPHQWKSEQVRLKFKSIAFRNLFNKHVRRVCHYTVLRFQGDATVRWYLGQGTLVTVVATQRLLHFLVLAQTWNFYSGKPPPEGQGLQNNIVHRIQIWVVWWSQRHVRLHDFHVCRLQSFYSPVRWRVVLQQRPLVMAASCTDAVSVSQKPIDCWPWPPILQTQRSSCLCAKRWPTSDNVMLEF